MSEEVFMRKREENRKRKAEFEVLLNKLEKRKTKTSSHFLWRREKKLRFKLFHYGYTQKALAKRLGLTESYIARLITGERYNRDFEAWIKSNLYFNYLAF
jgi:DNA-directed RNA polymerase specialized sigma subunit